MQDVQLSPIGANPKHEAHVVELREAQFEQVEDIQPKPRLLHEEQSALFWFVVQGTHAPFRKVLVRQKLHKSWLLA